MPNDQQSKQNITAINQEFKEKEIQEKANGLGLPYINLLNFHVNPDVLSILDEQDSKFGHIVVFFQIGKKIRVAVSDPNNIHAKGLIQNFKIEHFSVNVNLASEESITKVQEMYKSTLFKKEEKEDIKIEKEADEVIATEAIKEFEETTEKNLPSKKSSDALSDIHELAIKTNASDVHFQTEKDACHLRFRIDGMLQSISKIDYKTYDGIVKQIKMNSRLKLNVVDSPQDGQYFFTVNDRNVDMRVSTLPSVYGESVCLRLLDPKKGIAPLSDLGFKKYSLELIAKSLTKSEGIILLTGPTGSGKTTTLYSMMDVLNRPYRKIITLEDPVEYKLGGILQCEVSREDAEESNVTFTDGLIAILRQDPDVIMVGEIREPEVAGIAFQAAMTGHVVLSTLHSNSAIETLSRLRNLGVSDFMLAPALNMIVSQRLLRRICPHCADERDWAPKDFEHINHMVDKMHVKGISVPTVPKREKFGKGCEFCNKSGYHNRITVSEIILITDKLRGCIQNKESTNVILNAAIDEGFIDIKEDAIFKVIDGSTMLQEVVRVVGQ